MLLSLLSVCPVTTPLLSDQGVFYVVYCVLVNDGQLSYRLHWQKIRAIQMFTEHVLLNHANMVVYARRLDLVSVEYKHVHTLGRSYI